MSREKYKHLHFDSLKVKLDYGKKSSLAPHILLFIVLVFDESIITFFIGLSLNFEINMGFLNISGMGWEIFLEHFCLTLKGQNRWFNCSMKSHLKHLNSYMYLIIVQVLKEQCSVFLLLVFIFYSNSLFISLKTSLSTHVALSRRR